MRREPSSVVSRWLPLVYFGLSISLVFALLPSALRPPPQAPPTSAQLSPDAPPDDEVLLSSLGQGRSQTAGAVKAVGALETAEARPPKPVELKARKGKCFGTPSRQLESLYAPPCAPAFVGSNGGSTWRGITDTEIRIGFLMNLTGNASKDGEITDDPAQDNNAQSRTYRVLKQYFNQSLELYGRKLRFFYVQSKRDDSNDPAKERSAAKRAIEQYKIFAAINETSVATLDELSRGGVTTFTLGQVNRDFLAKRRPYAWSATPDSTGLIELGAEYLCAKLAGKPPKYTDDPTFDQSKPRVFGILSYQEGVGYEQNVPNFTRLMKERCGAVSVASVEYGLGSGTGRDSASTIPAAIAKLRAAGVTTVISLHDFLDNTYFTQESDNQKYYPEWYLPGFGGLDVVDVFFQTYAPQVWKHAFGYSVFEVPTVAGDHECARAYHSIDPDNDPDGGMCYYMWAHMVQLFGAMQLAGPKLTPDTLQQGLYKFGHHAPNPVWRMAGGYGPNDWTYPDYAAEIWYDPLATHVNGRLGAYRYVNGGRRFTHGEVPAGETPFFTDPGITQAPRGTT